MKTLFAAAVAALALTGGPALAQQPDTYPQIQVSATGEVKVTPDMASVTAGVVSEGLTAGEAMTRNSDLMNAVYRELEAAGIKRENIRTSQLSLQPRYDYSDRQAPRITGYEARNTVTMISYDLDDVGPMLDALVSAGVNNINGVSFGVEDPAEARDQARMDAIAKARRKAEMMASAANVRLGRVMLITENGGYQPPQPVMMRSAAMDQAESTPVSGGQQSVSITVNMTYEILQ